MSNRDILEAKVGSINITHPVMGLDYEDVIELMDSAVLASLEKLKVDIEKYYERVNYTDIKPTAILDLINAQIKEIK